MNWDASSFVRSATNRPGHTRPDVDKPESDLRLIPWWSVALSALVFFAIQILFHRIMPPPHPGTAAMRWIMSYSWGTALASYMLLIGYISRDVKRRNMSGAVWMLMVLLMPAGIGAVVYFLLRQPVMTRCPSCRTELAHDFHFCPQCSFQLAPVCGQCFRGVHITDVFCVQCGHDLAEDSMPARLRSYTD
jgi:hypothetical protein